MARTLNYDEDERERRIEIVGEYYFNTPGASVRSTAAYFKEHEFAISIATVSDYIARYKKKHPNESDSLQEVLDSRKPLTVDDDAVKERIAKEIVLLEEGLKVEEIAEMISESPMTVYRDLEVRLEKINETEFLKVKAILDRNRHSHPKKR